MYKKHGENKKEINKIPHPSPSHPIILLQCRYSYGGGGGVAPVQSKFTHTQYRIQNTEYETHVNKITNIPVFYKAFGLKDFYEGKSISQAIGRMLLHNVKQHNINVTWRNVTKHKRHITYSVTQGIPLQNVKFTLHKRYKMNVCFVTLYIMSPSGFDTFMFRLLTLCAATLSNIHVL